MPRFQYNVNCIARSYMIQIGWRVLACFGAFGGDTSSDCRGTPGIHLCVFLITKLMTLAPPKFETSKFKKPVVF